MRVKPAYDDEWGWLNTYLTTPEDVAATMMVAGGPMLQGLGRDNPYFERLRKVYVEQWKELHEEAREKVGRLRVPLKTFHIGDAVDWAGVVPEDAALVSFPPFYTNGYEIMFKGLSEVFSWPAPDYPSMDEERRQLFIDRMMTKKEWFVGTNYELPDCERFYCGFVQMTPRAMPVYVYASSSEDTRIVKPRQQTSPVKAPYLGQDEELGERMSISLLKAKEFSALRSAFLNPKIAVATGLGGYAVMVDGKLIGAFAVSTQTSFMGAALGAKVLQPHIYMMSDFAIRPTRYPHLSKLVLMAALSREAKLLFEREGNRRYRSIVSTAFTDKPVSMKYRGLFKLLTKTETDPHEDFKYKLNYGAELGQWSLAEGLELWRSKYGKEAVAA